MSELETSTRPTTDTAGIAKHRECVEAVLARKTPPRMVYAPNYWQWFAHHQNHGLLPEEIAHWPNQTEHACGTSRAC